MKNSKPSPEAWEQPLGSYARRQKCGDGYIEISWSSDDRPSLEELLNLAWVSLSLGSQNADALYERCNAAVDPDEPGLAAWLVANLPADPYPDAECRALTAQAWVAVTHAQRALEAGDLERVRAQLVCARRFRQLADKDYQSKAPHAARLANSARGGQKTAEHLEGPIALVTSLLQDRRPTGGWKTPRKAAQAIAGLVDDFLVQNPPPNMRSAKNGAYDTRAEQWIVDRIELPGAIREVYLATCEVPRVTLCEGDRGG